MHCYYTWPPSYHQNRFHCFQSTTPPSKKLFYLDIFCKSIHFLFSLLWNICSHKEKLIKQPQNTVTWFSFVSGAANKWLWRWQPVVKCFKRILLPQFTGSPRLQFSFIAELENAVKTWFYCSETIKSKIRKWYGIILIMFDCKNYVK